jgi:hypothetical protein
MTIDTSQNVGVNTTSPSYKLDVQRTAANGTGILDVLRLRSTGDNADDGPRLLLTCGNSTTGGAAIGAGGVALNSANLLFYAGGNTERMRIGSGGIVSVGTTLTDNPLGGFVLYVANQNSQFMIGHETGASSGNAYAKFCYNGSSIGTITQNGTTGVLYNLTSDYRLKNNPVALTGAKDFVMALQPKKWQWWDGSGEGVGFIAHEFMEVAKYSGNGTKDAVETIEIKDEQGNVTGTEQRPIMQSIQPSSSEVMANLVAFIQEQQATITAQAETINALTARIVALESK